MSRAFPHGYADEWLARLHLGASSRSCGLETAQESSRSSFALPDARSLFSVVAGEWAGSTRHRSFAAHTLRARGTEDRALRADASTPREAAPALLAELLQWNRQPPTDARRTASGNSQADSSSLQVDSCTPR